MSDQDTSTTPVEPDEIVIKDNSIEGETPDIEDIDPDSGRSFIPGRSVLSDAQIRVLMASRINSNRVKSRKVSGRNTSYVEAWDIKATLTKVFGFGGWSGEVIESRIIDVRDDGRQGTYTSGEKQGQTKTPYVMAYARYRLTLHNIGPMGQDVVYIESSIGTNDGSTIGDVADNAIKTAASDALKRCASNLGTQFGLSLYNAGDHNDVIKVLGVPWQAAALARARGAVATVVNGTQAAIARATGGVK